MPFSIAERPQHLSTLSTRALAIAGMQGIGGAMPPHISIKGNRFSLVDAAGNVRPIDTLSMNIIVLDVNPVASKIFYEDAYDPSAVDTKPPTCFSDNGLAPSMEASVPQHATCAGCQWNAWGSDVSPAGAKIKACRDYKKIAVFTSLQKDVQFQLRIPPNSLKGWKLYCANLGASGADLFEVVTKISFDPEQQGTLLFDPVDWVPQNFMPWYERLIESGKTKTLTGVLDKPIEGTAIAARPAKTATANTLPPPKQPPVKRAAAPAPAPQAVAQAEMEVMEPVAAQPARTRSVATPAPSAPVAEADEMEIPEFLKRQERQSPGMATAVAKPDASLGAALDDAFAL